MPFGNLHKTIIVIAKLLLVISILLWAITIYLWINGSAQYEPWNVLFAAIITTALSVISFFNKDLKKKKEGKILMDNKSLFAVLESSFNLTELEKLCLNLDIDYEILAGNSKDKKILELINYLSRRDQLDKLYAAVKVLRPNIFNY